MTLSLCAPPSCEHPGLDWAWRIFLALAAGIISAVLFQGGCL